MSYSIGLNEKLIDTALMLPSQFDSSAAFLAGSELAIQTDPSMEQVRDAFNDQLLHEWYRASNCTDSETLSLVFSGMLTRLAERHPHRVQEVVTPTDCHSVLGNVSGVLARVTIGKQYQHVGFGATNSDVTIEQADFSMVGHHSENSKFKVLTGTVRSIGYGAENGIFISEVPTYSTGERSRKSTFIIHNDANKVLNFAFDGTAVITGNMHLRSLAAAKNCFVECDGIVTGSVLHGLSKDNELYAKEFTGTIWNSDVTYNRVATHDQPQVNLPATNKVQQLSH